MNEICTNTHIMHANYCPFVPFNFIFRDNYYYLIVFFHYNITMFRALFLVLHIQFFSVTCNWNRGPLHFFSRVHTRNICHQWMQNNNWKSWYRWRQQLHQNESKMSTECYAQCTVIVHAARRANPFVVTIHNYLLNLKHGKWNLMLFGFI